MKINFLVLIISIVVVFIVAAIGGLFTSRNTGTEWYQSIKPSITPPNWVFPIVWNFLFLLIAISLYVAWTSASTSQQRTLIIIVFAINFILNILWSAIYFGMQNPSAAFVEIIFLWLSILAMIIVLWGINKVSSYLLIPYLLWVGFASVLNYLSIK